MQAIMETAFDVVYLVTVVTLGVVMVKQSQKGSQGKLFGRMAILLGCGDAFHLVPRAWALCTTGLADYAAATDRAAAMERQVEDFYQTSKYLLHHNGKDALAQAAPVPAP